ncbi:MAG: helix-turn-helix transcriptional regulator [Saprospiraceae bacterium]|nr:helix-turn-helix transcriptional regulator [Saprospiraceae bacterium]
MEKRVFKDSIYSAIAGLTKAFGNANRLEILDLLANGEKTVEQIAMQTAITIANASQHLQVLKNARLVKARRDGNFIFYTINGRKAYAAWQALRDLALEAEPAVQVTLQKYRKEAGNPQSFMLDELPSSDLALRSTCAHPTNLPQATSKTPFPSPSKNCRSASANCPAT